MTPTTNPLAPDPITDIDSPDVFPPIEEGPQEDLTEAVPLGEDDDDEMDPDDEDELEEEEEEADEEDPL